MDTRTFSELVAGIDKQYLADYLQVDIKTMRRWVSGTSKPPHSAIIALRLHLDGDLSAIGGADWAGFVLRGGKLTAPMHHRPFDPFQIQAMFFEVQASRHHQNEVKRLELELAKLKKSAWAADKLSGIVRQSSFAAFDSRASRPAPPPCDSFADKPR